MYVYETTFHLVSFHLEKTNELEFIFHHVYPIFWIILVMVVMEMFAFKNFKRKEIWVVPSLQYHPPNSQVLESH
jgi:hypothetical protein